jgi:hypothetical protein
VSRVKGLGRDRRYFSLQDSYDRREAAAEILFLGATLRLRVSSRDLFARALGQYTFKPEGSRSLYFFGESPPPRQT